MARTSRTYERVREAEELIKKIQEKYPKLLWAIRPEQIAVMGCDNQERSEKAVEKNPAYAKLRMVKGAEKAVFEDNKIPIRYILELFWSDWNSWSPAYRQWVLLNSLMEITPEVEKRNGPDCVGFKVLLSVCGVNWDRESNSLPNILTTDVDFNLDLLPGLDDEDENPDEGEQEPDSDGDGV